MTSLIEFAAWDYGIFFSNPNSKKPKAVYERHYCFFNNLCEAKIGKLQSFFTDQPLCSLNFGLELAIDPTGCPGSVGGGDNCTVTYDGVPRVQVDLVPALEMDFLEGFEQKILQWLDFGSEIHSVKEIERLCDSGNGIVQRFDELETQYAISLEICKKEEQTKMINVYENSVRDSIAQDPNSKTILENFTRGRTLLNESYFALVGDMMALSTGKRSTFIVNDENVKSLESDFNFNLVRSLLSMDKISLRVSVRDADLFKKCRFYSEFLAGELGLRFDKLNVVVNKNDALENLDFESEEVVAEKRGVFGGGFDDFSDSISALFPRKKYSQKNLAKMNGLKNLNKYTHRIDMAALMLAAEPFGIAQIDKALAEIGGGGAGGGVRSELSDPELAEFCGNVFKNTSAKLAIPARVNDFLTQDPSWWSYTNRIKTMRTTKPFSFYTYKGDDSKNLLPIYLPEKSRFSVKVNRVTNPVSIFTCGTGRFEYIGTISPAAMFETVHLSTFFGGVIFLSVENKTRSNYLDVEFRDVMLANHIDFNSKRFLEKYKRNLMLSSHFLIVSVGDLHISIPTRLFKFEGNFSPTDIKRDMIREILDVMMDNTCSLGFLVFCKPSSNGGSGCDKLGKGFYRPKKFISTVEDFKSCMREALEEASRAESLVESAENTAKDLIEFFNLL